MKFLFNKKISFTLIFFIFIFLFFILQIKPVFAVLTVTQNYFRWYSQKDAADPDDPWPSGATDLAENEAIGLDDVPPGSEDTLRIRMSLYVYSEEGEALEPGMTEFKLQWAAKDGASCSGEGEAWSALDAGAWIGYDNGTPNDGDPIDRGLLSVTDVAETYEERNNASIQNPINSTEDGEWDWSIKNASATPNTVYCFRMVYLDDAPLDGYDYYPELITEAITVSGTVYTDEGSTNIGADKTVVIKVNGADKCNGTSACTAETNASGQYSISNLDIDAANDVLTVFIDEETENATTVTKANNTTADITGLNLYANRLILRHEGASAITNADLAQYDDDQDDDDIRFDSDSGALTVYNDTELHVWTGKTFSPGGTVTTNANACAAGTITIGSDIHIDDNAVFIAGGAISAGNNWAADTGSTFTHNNNMVTFTATALGCTIAANSQNFYDVIFNGSGGGWSFSSTTTISNDLTMTAGTLSGTSDLTINGGDASGDGTINLTADSTFTLDGTGNFGGATAWTFNTLTFGDGSGATTTTATGSGGITASKALIISANQTLDAGSKTWTLSGTTGTPFVKTGTFTANSSTFSYTGNNSGGNTTIVATTYNHLIVNNGSETYVLSGETSLNGDLTITAGTLDVTLSSYALNVKGSFITTGTFQARGGVVTLNGTSSGKTIGAGPFYDLIVNGTGGQWTVTTAKLRINNDLTITAGTLLDSNNLGVVLLGSLSIGGAGYFTKGSGDFTFETAGTETWTDGNLIISQDLGNVVLAGGGTLALASSVKCTSVDIQGANIFDLKNHTFTITGSGTGGSAPLKITDGTLTLGTSTINYSSGSDTTVLVSDAWNYYNLTLSGAGPFTLGAGLYVSDTIDNNLSISGGRLSLSAATTIIGNDVSISDSGELSPAGSNIQVGGSWTNSATFTSGGAGTVDFTAMAAGETITAGGSPFFNLSFTGVGGGWTMQDALDVNGIFNLAAGTLVQAADANINLGDNVSLANGATFTKASGSGLVIFDGTAATFTDNNVAKQNLGNVHIGTSPDDTILCTDTVMDSLTINAGDVYYLNQWDIDVTNEITVVGTGLLDAQTDQSGVCAAGDGSAINLETDWSLGAADGFKAGTSVVTFDGAQNSNIDVGASSNSFYDLVLAKDSGETVTIINSNIDIDNDLTIGATSVFDVGTDYDINIGGSWANSGTFTCQSGIVTFDSTDTGETIDSGGDNFYAIVFNNSGGGWTIQTNNITATNFTITSANTFVLDSGRTATVTGTFTNSVGGAATTWTGSTLYLNGTSHTINTKSAGADAYATLQVGANTDIRMWNSSASTYTVNSSGSLYSMDHGATDGSLYIYGDYHTTNGSTDYWSYGTDFDGAVLGPGAVRLVKVYLSGTSPAVTVDSGGILNVIGGGAASNDITVVGQDASALWDFTCSGTCNVQESTWNYLNLKVGTLTVVNSTLNNEDEPDAGAVLNVDWYLGAAVFDYIDPPSTPIDTGDNDITISENSDTPASTVFVWSGSAWSVAATSQTTGTGGDGKIPQPGTNGAIRIREYKRESTGYTYYKYNINIADQGSSYGEYDYYRGYGDNYITSTLNTSSGEDECISESWQRNNIDVQNNPAQAIDQPPTNGTWYNGMISGLSFTVNGVAAHICTITGGTSVLATTETTIPFSSILAENFYDACQSLQVSTSAGNGYIVTIQELDQMTAGSEQIADGSCDGGCSETVAAAWDTNTNNGFAYCMDDQTGTAANTADSTYWTTANQCGGGTQSFKIIPENDVDSPDTANIMKNTNPVYGDNSFVGFRLSVDATQPAGVYSTTIIYVVTANY